MSGPFQYVPSVGFGQQVAAPLIHAVANQWAVGPTPPLTPSSSLQNSPMDFTNNLPGHGFDPQHPRIFQESFLPPATTLKWDELLVLLQAGCNPRFSGTLANAHYQIINGAFGDSLSLIGGFPYVVRDVLPNAPDFPRRQDIGTNTQVEASLGLYIGQPSASNWNGVLRALYAVAPTPDHQNLLANAVFHALINGFTNLLTVNQLYSPEVAMVVVMASMSCQDRSHYGSLGKMGNSHLKICPQIFLGTNNSGVPQTDSLKPAVLVRAFVHMASAVVVSKVH